MAAAAASAAAGPEPAATGTPAAAPRRKHVVTAFVQRPDDGRVLVVLRSDKARLLLFLSACRGLPMWVAELAHTHLTRLTQLTPPAPRARQVGTYKRMWGAVSGGIEGGDESPVFRCQQEASAPLAWAGLAAARCACRLVCRRPPAVACAHPVLQPSPAHIMANSLNSPQHPRQILEEAGLEADQVQLVRSGRPLVVDDGEAASGRLLHRKAIAGWLCTV